MRLTGDEKEGPDGALLASPGRRRLLAGALLFAAATPSFVRSASTKAQLTTVNRWPTGNTTLYPFTLADGHLYSNGNATVEAHDIHKGDKLWGNKLDAPAVFRPRLADNLLISAGRSQLTAWDRLSGDKAWSYKGDKELGVPLAHHGRIHFGEGHRLTTLDAGTGEHRWSFATDARARVAYAPAGDGDMIYLGAGDGVLYALSAEDGRLIWKTDREKDWQYLRQLAVSEDILVAGGYHDEIFGIDKHGGDIRWRFNAGNFINSQLVTREATFFWSPTGWVYAVGTGTGKILWRHRTIDYNNRNRKENWAPIMSEMVTGRDHLYVLAMDHVLHVLSTKTGAETARFQMPAPMRPFIVLEENTGRVLTGSESGEVFYLEAMV